MNYCLNSNELECIINFTLTDKYIDIEDEVLKLHLNNALQWQDRLIGLTFSFARILERRRGSKSLIKETISSISSMPEKMFIEIEECGEGFVDYMLRHEHSGEVDLEISLLNVAKNMSYHCYGQDTLRD